MSNYLNQRISTKKKNKKWREKALDYYIDLSYDCQSNWKNIEENYNLKNNKLDRDEIIGICKGLGSEKNTNLFVNAYNKTHNIIDALQGEEWGRPFTYGIVNNSKKAIDKIDRDKRREIDSIAKDMFKLEVQRQNELFEIEQSFLDKQDERQYEKQLEELEKRHSKLYGSIVDPKSIFDKYANITTAEEEAISRIMRMHVSKLNIKFIKNKTFEDVCIAGIEAVEIYSLGENDLPRVRQINPKTLYFQKSPDVMWIQDADYAGYLSLMTVGNILESYGEFLSKSDYQTLTDFDVKGEKIEGLDYPYMVSKSNRMKSFNGKKGMNRRSRHSGNEIITLGDEYGGDTFGNIISDSVKENVGLSVDGNYVHSDDYIEVNTVYWKSQRKIGRYEFINDYGEQEETFVDELFMVPKSAKREIVSDGYNKNKVIHTWNEGDNTFLLEWIWIPEVWKGIRIGGEIYCQIGPVKHAYQSLLNPYDVKLPIYGHIYNNRNAESVSIMDRLKPWQKIYYVIIAKLLKMVSKDRGILTFLNIALLDKNLGFAEALKVAEDSGIVPYNALGNSKGAGGFGNMNTMKIAEKIDATNSQTVQYYMSLLNFIEENIKLAAGMSDQRMAQTSARTTATDNHRDTMHSINITETLHAAHDLLWESVLQGLMEMMLSVLDKSTGKIRGFLNDEEKVLIDLDLLTLEDNFKLRVADNSKANKILEQSQNLAQALIQNDKISFDGLIEMMEAESLSQLKNTVRESEATKQEIMDSQRQSEQAHEKEMLEMQRKIKEDDQIARLDETYLKGRLDYAKELMKANKIAASFDSEKDYNKDGIPDYMQQKQIQQKINNESREIDLKEFKLIADEKKQLEALENEKIKRQMEMSDKETNNLNKALDRNSKQRIEDMKLKAMKLKNK